MEDSAHGHMISIQGKYLRIWFENKLYFYNYITPNTWISLYILLKKSQKSLPLLALHQFSLLLPVTRKLCKKKPFKLDQCIVVPPFRAALSDMLTGSCNDFSTM